jgi:hypothetical protein
VDEATLGENFEEGRSIVHARGDELTVGLGIRPAPGRATRQEHAITLLVPTVGRSQCRVVDEVVQVDVLALERVQGVARDGRDNTVDALGVVQARVDRRVEETGVGLGEPTGDLPGLVALVDDASVVQLC